MKTLLVFGLFSFLFFNIYSQGVPHNLRCTTIGTPNGTQTQFNEIGYYINNFPIEYNGCQSSPAIIVAVIDSFCQPWNTCDHSFAQNNIFNLTAGSCGISPVGNGTCRNRPENYFIFQFNNVNQVNGLANMINAVPNDDYILAYTWYTFPYSTVPIFIQAFQNIGASLISTLPDTVPYIFFIKKGDITSLVETAGITSGDSISINTIINCNTSSVSEIENDLINFFPDPVLDHLSISVRGINYEWEIFNVTGQQVLSGKIVNGNSVIHFDNLSGGLYVFRLMNEKGMINRIFCKE